MLGWLKGLFTGKPALRLRGADRRLMKLLRGRYDAAVTNPDNIRHWAGADGLSANAAACPEVRRILRNRSRYEVANNSYARGIILTLANDVVGTGPRLQMLAVDPKVNDAVEASFADWATAVSLAEKLRTMRMARAEDGEAFGILTNNSGLSHKVKLDLRLVEADQVSTPDLSLISISAIDGIVYDGAGNPVEYHVLKNHPGDLVLGFGLDYDRLPASSVLHYFRADRPGQGRGIPEITSALPLFAQLRRYTLAVIAAAESAADFAGILYTDSPANGESDAVEAMDTIELERRMLVTMPGGWKMGQLHAEQPATTYAEFKREILNEIARCLNMPFNVAAGNSSGYNYASGRLDHQTYFKSIRVDQAHLEEMVLDRIFRAWVREAVLVDGLLPQAARLLSTDWNHQWFWDGQEHVDPAKEASAQETRLRNNTTTLADEYAKRGQDWETQLRQRGKEVALIAELGIAPVPAQPPLQPAPMDTGSGDTGNAAA